MTHKLNVVHIIEAMTYDTMLGMTPSNSFGEQLDTRNKLIIGASLYQDQVIIKKYLLQTPYKHLILFGSPYVRNFSIMVYSYC